MSYFRQNIDAMTGYAPGEQPAAGAKVIKLNTNENPYPPSPAALAALQSIGPDALRRYPNPMADAFRQTVSDVLGVPVENILAGNGSDDLLTMIIRAFVAERGVVAYPMPTYVLYRTLTEIQDGRAVETPYPDDYFLPADALSAVPAKVTFVASPNSPSGTLHSIDELDYLARRVAGVLVVDEAYADFADANALDLARRRKNVVILRTLSKGYGLAGLRLGFAVGDAALLDGLGKVKDSYNVDAVACAVGAAAFADQPYKNACADRVKASRATLKAGLEELGLSVLPSQSNFLLATVPPPLEAETVYQALKDRGILVRYFRQNRLDDKLRITVGTDEDNAALIAGLRSAKCEVRSAE
jgi:histidinol-phosphate aminotransferase